MFEHVRAPAPIKDRGDAAARPTRFWRAELEKPPAWIELELDGTIYEAVDTAADRAADVPALPQDRGAAARRDGAACASWCGSSRGQERARACS